MQSEKKWLGWAALAVGVALLLAVNIFSGNVFRTVRLDLTEGQLFTLSEGSKNLLNNLEEPVTLRLFLSQDLATRLPGINSYAQRVKDLLEEYRRAGRGNVTVRIIDPEPFSEAEDRAVGYGLQGVPLGDGETTFYFGLVATGPTDRQAAVPFLTVEQEAFLEYDITRLVYEVVWADKTVVGLMTGLPMEGPAPHGGMVPGAQGETWVILDQMRQLFDVRTLETSVEAIPEDIDVLMLAEPGELGEATEYAIDQFLMRGGRILAFVDPLPDSLGGRAPPVDGGHPLERLLTSWGIEFPANEVVADLRLAEQVQFSGGGRPMVVDYPIWLKVPQGQLNEDDVVTAGLGNLLLASAGHLRVTGQEGISAETLAQTTRAATVVDAARVSFVSDPQSLLRDYQPGGESLALALRLTGTFRSAFPEGAPGGATPAQAGAGGEPADDPPPGPGSGGAGEGTGPETASTHLGQTAEPGNLIVVADSDLLQDRFWVRVQNLLGTRLLIPLAANGSLVTNALDNLAGSSDLISVRNRALFSRPFTRVNRLRQEAELRFREKEQELLNRLSETEARLLNLEQGKQEGGALVLSAEQRGEIDRFRQEKVQIRRELRQVRHQLRRDIERLERRTKFFNIALVPMLIAVGGVILGIRRLRRRARRARLAQAH